MRTAPFSYFSRVILTRQSLNSFQTNSGVGHGHEVIEISSDSDEEDTPASVDSTFVLEC